MIDRDPTIDFAQRGVDMRRPRELADRHAPADREHVLVNQLAGMGADDLGPDDLLAPSSLIEHFDFPDG